MHPKFKEIVRTEEQIRAIMGEPSHRVVAKVISKLDEHCRAYIGKSPFVLLASSDGEGHVDVSPKGDPPGFVHVLDDHTLAIPDRVGNRRADSFHNILQNEQIGLLFLIPGKQETLRVSGTAMIVRDGWLREEMVHKGKAPDFALVVTVEEAFIHCAKCMMRSSLWDVDSWSEVDGLASIAQVMIDHGNLTQDLDEMEALVAESYRDRLY